MNEDFMEPSYKINMYKAGIKRCDDIFSDM